MKVQNLQETQFKHSCLVYFRFPLEHQKKHQNLQNIQSKSHINTNSPEGLQACPACRKLWLSCVGLTPLNNSVVQLFFLLHAYTSIPCKSSGERQTNASVARLCSFILSQCFGPNNVFTITTRMKEKRWQEGISR